MSDASHSDEGRFRLPARQPLPIAVLISGAGSTLKNLFELQTQNQLDIEIRLVISSRESAGGLAYAEQFGVPSVIIRRDAFDNTQSFSDEIFSNCTACDVSLVVMGGFLKHIFVPPAYEHRVINVHPSLIPAFCGEGYYGKHVHQAVIDYGCKLSGCTIHFVDNQYDHGPIIAQKTVDVLAGDTADDLAKRVGILERSAYPDVIQAIAEGKVSIANRQVSID